MKYGYQAEKLAAARRCLMLPHPDGIEHSIAAAFHNCMLAFERLHEKDLDDHAREWVTKIKALMDTSKIRNDSAEAAWATKARAFSSDQLLELSHMIDELADWFRIDELTEWFGRGSRKGRESHED